MVVNRVASLNGALEAPAACTGWLVDRLLGMRAWGAGRLVIALLLLSGGVATAADGPSKPAAKQEKSRANSAPSSPSDQAKAAAVDWIVRHQMPNGSWSLKEFSTRCKAGAKGRCNGAGEVDSDAAATALALLPLVGAGHVHSKPGPYQEAVRKGLYWLLENRKSDGSLSAGSSHEMYTHALATVCICEAYRSSGDQKLGEAGKAAIDFIIRAQNRQHGGWRYQRTSGDGDTSVVGMQVMALASGQTAFSSERPVSQSQVSTSLEQVKKWLALVATGRNRALYRYTPESTGPTAAMTAVGMLMQYMLGMKSDHPTAHEGVEFLMQRTPDSRTRDLYYWYYGSRVMRNVGGENWKEWSRLVQSALVETQCKDGCMAGSWNPALPTAEPLGQAGGRLAVSSFCVMTLQVQ